jgi:hypothetical protein
MDRALQEHLDYEFSRYRNEFQAAYDLSKLCRKTDERITHALDQNKHVVVFQFEEYCGYTDAFMGVGQSLHQAFDDWYDADFACRQLNEELKDEPLGFKVLSPTYGEVR